MDRPTSPFDWLAQRNAQLAGEPIPMRERIYKISEAAELLGCCTTTIRRWAARDFAQTTRSGPRGWHRICESELRRLRGELRRAQKFPVKLSAKSQTQLALNAMRRTAGESRGETHGD